MKPSNNQKKTNIRHRTYPELAERTIKDYLSQVETQYECLALMSLAEEAMAQSAWLAGEEIAIEKIFEGCKTSALLKLGHRLDRWQSKVAAIQTHSQAAH
jgi:hypothetical protein